MDDDLNLDLDWGAPDLDPGAILARVRALDNNSIEAALATPDRDRILRGIFGAVASIVDPVKANGIDAAIHFKIWDRPGGGYDHLEIVVVDGSGTLSPIPSRQPKLTIKGRASDLMRVALGEANPIRLGLARRIGVAGDLGFARKLDGLFDLPGR